MLPPPLASTLLVDAMLVVALAFARAEAILVCGAAAVLAALRTVRVARRTAIGGRLAVAWGVALGMPAEAALCTWQVSPARTAAPSRTGSRSGPTCTVGGDPGSTRAGCRRWAPRKSATKGVRGRW